MAIAPLSVVVTRSGLPESAHAVHVAVTDTAGHLVASAGDAQRKAWWRSAAKPVQAVCCVDDGAADAAGFDDACLALACASHSGEDVHTAVAARMLAGCGCVEDDLACGPHPSLSASVARAHVRAGTRQTPIHNNCSGKHAAMLALCAHRGWPKVGYEDAAHPAQQRIVDELVRQCGTDDIDVGTDNCRARTFRVALSGMARAWAQVGASSSPGLTRLRCAMWAHPHLVAGTERSCTTFLQAAPERLLVKVGAEGVYCAALPALGVGVALKVESGDGRAATVALAAVVRALDERHGSTLPHEAWTALASPTLKDTRGEPVGTVISVGDLVFV